MSRHNNIDLLRFLAAALVLLSHCFPLLGRDHEEPIRLFTHLENGGGFAVSAFFVLSGYLVTGSYVYSRSVIEYLVKRMLRLFPALVVVVLISIFLLGPALTTFSLTDYFHHPHVGNYLTNIYLLVNYQLPGLFTTNPHPYAVNGSLWTLPIEFLMYLVVAMLGLGKCLKPWSVGVVIALCWIIHFAVLPAYGAERWIFFWVIQAQDAAKLGAFFFSGGLLYLVRESYRPTATHVGIALIVLYLGASTIYAMAAFMAALPLMVMYLAFVPSGRLANFGKHGDFSYGIYIYAFPIQQAVIQIAGNAISPVSLFALTLFPTLFLAYLSWHLVEHPALKLKTRFTRMFHPNTLVPS